MNPKVKTMKGERVGEPSLNCNISGVEGLVGALERGLERLISSSITHTNMYKPNNKLVNA
jgi:hypothetical protein